MLTESYKTEFREGIEKASTKSVHYLGLKPANGCMIEVFPWDWHPTTVLGKDEKRKKKKGIISWKCGKDWSGLHSGVHWYYMWKLWLYFPFKSSYLLPLLGSASLISQQSQPSSVMFGLIWWSVPWHCLHSESTDTLVLGISRTELSVWCELLIFNWADSMHHWCLESWQSRLMLMHQHV